MVPDRNDVLRCARLGRECVAGLVSMSKHKPTSVTLCITHGDEYHTSVMGYPAIGTYETTDGTKIFGYAAGLREMGEALLDLAEAAENYQHNQTIDALALEGL